jgi:hypothetical protein
VTAGWQHKTTSGEVKRITHDFFRSDLPSQYRGRGVLTEFDTVKYIVDMWVYDSTQAAGHTIKFSSVIKPKQSKQDGSRSLAILPPTTLTPLQQQWMVSYHYDRPRQRTIYVCVYSNFAIDVAIVLYGKSSIYNTSDTSITRRRYTSYTDTAGALKDLSGINSAGALPNDAHYFRDSLLIISMRTFLQCPLRNRPPLSSVLGMQDPTQSLSQVSPPLPIGLILGLSGQDWANQYLHR